MFMEMHANLGEPKPLLHRSRTDSRGAPLRGTLVCGRRAGVEVDGMTTSYVTFEALVGDGWRFDLEADNGEARSQQTQSRKKGPPRRRGGS
jgi:hypothetical protein